MQYNIKINNLLFIILLYITFSGSLSARQVLNSSAIETAPVIDGIADENVWQQAQAVEVVDKVLSVPIEIKSLHTDKMVFFKVRFADNKEQREHKTMHWDETLKRYAMGGKREDIFVFKWNMENIDIDLSVYGSDEYKADIWYWKAMRTDHSGHADDKLQQYTRYKRSKTKKIINKKGELFYLSRKGDSGTSAYQSQFYAEKQLDSMPRFAFRPPQGSRADVKAKGIWENGYWTIEFARKLDTGHDDDRQFDLNTAYLFGVSLNELAARKPDAKLEKPNFGSGLISELIRLKFQP